jgi:hypothetical protein
LLAFFAIAFALYPAAEAGAAAVEIVLLGLLVGVMALAIWTG